MADEYNLPPEYTSGSDTRISPARSAEPATNLMNEKLAEYEPRNLEADPVEIVRAELSVGGVKPTITSATPDTLADVESKVTSTSLGRPRDTVDGGATSAAMDKVAESLKEYPVGKPTRTIVRARIIDERGSS